MPSTIEARVKRLEDLMRVQLSRTSAVTSVFGRTGAVTATEDDYDLDQLGDVTITSPADDHFLRYNGTAWVNESVTLSTAYTLLATVTAGASDAALTASSLTAYREYLIEYLGAGGTQTMYLRLNNDSGTNYNFHVFGGTEQTGQDKAAVGERTSCTAIIRILGAASGTAGVRQCIQGFQVDNQPDGWVVSAGWNGNAQVNRVDLIPTTGNFTQDSVMRVYGVR